MNTNLAKVLLFLILVFYASCSESEGFINESDDTIIEEPSGDINLLDEKTFANYYVNEENALVFETIDDCVFLLDSISKLDEDEFIEWENKINFASYRTYTKNLIESLEGRTSIDINNEKYLEWNDELEMITPKIPSQLYSSILNHNASFYINETKNIVDEQVFTAETVSVSDQTHIDTKSTIGSGVQVGNIIDYPAVHSDIYSGSYKIMTWCKIYKLRIYDAALKINRYSIVWEISVRPRKWNGLVGWKDHESVCYIEELKLHMKGLSTTTVRDEDGYWQLRDNEFMRLFTTASSKKTKLYTASIHMKFFYSDPGNLVVPYCLHYRARIKDTGKYGAVYNIKKPAPGISCKHREVTPYQHTEYSW